jgi:hypothetical protein
MSDDRDETRHRLIGLLRKYVGKTREIEDRTLIHHDLGISGDDADDLLNEIANEFGVTFAGFVF